MDNKSVEGTSLKRSVVLERPYLSYHYSSAMAAASIHQNQHAQQATDKVTLADAISNVDVLDDVVLCDDVP